MLNFYFIGNDDLWNGARIVTGAEVYRHKINDKYTAIVTQTGDAKSYIYLSHYNTDEITQAIAFNHSDLVSQCMADLMMVWSGGKVRYVHNYAPHSVSFAVKDLHEHGDRWESGYLRLYFKVEVSDYNYFIPFMKDNGIRILSPDIILYCDNAIRYNSYWHSNCEPDYTDYSTANNDDKLLFMHSIYDNNARFYAEREKLINTRDVTKWPLRYYGYTREQVRELVYNQTVAVRELYTIAEIESILTMRGKSEGKPTTYNKEEGKKILDERLSKDAKDGGIRDYRYSMDKKTRMMRIAIKSVSPLGTAIHYHEISDMPVYQYLSAKSALLEAVASDGWDATTTHQCLAQLSGYDLPKLKIAVPLKHTTEWEIWLEEIIDLADSDTATITKLETIYENC